MQTKVSSSNMSLDQSSTNPFVRPPNRNKFETNIALVTKKIKENEAKYVSLTGSLNNSWRRELTRLKEERDQVRKTMPSVNTQLTDIRKQLAAKKEEISKIESDGLYYKDQARQTAWAQSLQRQYDNQTFNDAREESLLVKEINKAKRSQRLLDKFKKAKVERDDLNKKTNNLLVERDELFRKTRFLKSKETQVRDLAKEHQYLNTEKQMLIQTYNRELTEYAQWSKQSGRPKKSSFDSTNRQQQASVRRTSSWKQHSKQHNVNQLDEDSGDSDDGEYEPFAKEKQLCRKLMAFCERFDRNILTATNSGDSQEGADVQTTKNGDIESDNPLSLPIPRVLRKHSKKDKRKTTQAIPIEPQIFVDFETVGVTAPVNYNEIPVAYEKLKERLKFYDEQLSLNLRFSYSYDEFAYPSSESEMTTDSAMFSVLSCSEIDDSSSLYTGQNLSQASVDVAEKKCVVEREVSSSCKVDSSLKPSEISRVRAVRSGSSMSCGELDEIFASNGKDENWDESKNGSRKFSSLDKLDAKLRTAVTFDEGIDVFLSKDSSTGSNSVAPR